MYNLVFAQFFTLIHKIIRTPDHCFKGRLGTHSDNAKTAGYSNNICKQLLFNLLSDRFGDICSLPEIGIRQQ